MAKFRSVIRNSQIQQAPDKDVDVEIISPTRLVGTHGNMIPMFNNAQSPRSFYGMRFLNQAMPIANREAPLVQSLDPESDTEDTFEHQFGRRMGAKFYDDDDEATVVSVDPDEIVLQKPDGSKKTVNLYNNFQFNRKTQISNKPLVKPGDKVNKGNILASSNYTDDNGTVSLGVNARVALVPYKGYSMDDAIVVSESFAKKLSSEHSYEHDIAKDSDTKFGKDHFSSLFPTKFTREQLENIDDDGIAKPGTVLHKGDPIILATKPKAISSNTHLGKLGKTFRQMRTDASEIWDHDYPGTVADSVNGKKNVKAFINAVKPAQIGDKIIAARNGQKCYNAETEVLTEKGWKRICEVTTEDKVAALFDRNSDKTQEDFGVTRPERIPQDLYAKFVHPVDTTSYEYDGELCCLETTYAAYSVTPNHRVWCSCNGDLSFSISEAESIHGNSRKFMVAADFDIEDRVAPKYMEIPVVPYATVARRHTTVSTNHGRYAMLPFLKFLAFYLCEGNIKKAPSYYIILTQKERPFCRKIEKVIDQLGLSWKKYNNQYFIGPDKSLATYLSQFGHAHDKFIPEWVFDLPKNLLRVFIDWAWQGDGDKYKGSKFYSSSPRMIEGIQRILIMLGYKTSYSVRARRSHQNYDSYTLTKFKTARYVTSDVGNAFIGRDPEKGYFKMPYKGMVGCCQVPGLGVILTRYKGRVMWNGNSIISTILPDEQMVRSVDGKPFDVMLNPLCLPSRVNTATPYELQLGKIAAKTGKPYKVSAFGKPGQSRLDFVRNELAKHGLSDTEEVFDPVTNRKLEKPVTTGVSYVYKLHHVVDSKLSARGQGAYDNNGQPVKGGGEGAQAKRMGGLETTALMAKGAYATLREGSTLRGSANDSYWRSVREGYHPNEPGAPFAWEKFQILLNGAGLNARDLGHGIRRISPFTDKDLADNNPIEVKSGKLVNLNTLEGEPDGLFAPELVAGNRWGKVTLPHPVPNPAFEKQILQILNVTESDFRKVLAGEMTLKEAQENKLKK